jgi:hypothetical protein
MEKEVQTSDEYLKQMEHPFSYPHPIFLKTWCLYAKRRGIHS